MFHRHLYAITLAKSQSIFLQRGMPMGQHIKRELALPQIWLIRQKICFAIPQKSGRAKRKFCRKTARHHPVADFHAPALYRTGSYPAAGGGGRSQSPEKSYLPILGIEHLYKKGRGTTCLLIKKKSFPPLFIFNDLLCFYQKPMR